MLSAKNSSHGAFSPNMADREAVSMQVTRRKNISPEKMAQESSRNSIFQKGKPSSGMVMQLNQVEINSEQQENINKKRGLSTSHGTRQHTKPNTQNLLG
jgi:hypothetical protein